MSETPPTPCSTLYIKNLNDRVKPDRLKQSLYELFMPFGRVLEIHLKKKLRGQAFIVFQSKECAMQALKDLQSTTIHEKEMIIQYAKTKSDITAQFDGSLKAHITSRKRKLLGLTEIDTENNDESNEKLPTYTKTSMNISPDSDQANTQTKKSKFPPSRRLVIQNLPSGISKTALKILFQQYTGFKNVLVAPAVRMAFIEFNSIPDCTEALEKAQHVKLQENHVIDINFAQ